MEEIRLNKYLSEMGICSRREADRLITAGRVLVDGKPAVMGQKIAEGQKVVCDGRSVGTEMSGASAGSGRPPRILLAVNKPKGIVCTTSEKDRAENIVQFLRYPERIYPVGRLDKDSEGLLLMTNRGDLVNRIMRAGNYHEKEYQVRVDRPVTPEFLERMAAGVEILDTVTRPCKVEQTGEDSFQIVLTQGLNRQIRRMCEALGYRVIHLKRTRIMNIRLGNLKTGAFRPVTGEEEARLMELLRDSVNAPGGRYGKKTEKKG